MPRGGVLVPFSSFDCGAHLKRHTAQPLKSTVPPSTRRCSHAGVGVGRSVLRIVANRLMRVLQLQVAFDDHSVPHRDARRVDERVVRFDVRLQRLRVRRQCRTGQSRTAQLRKISTVAEQYSRYY